jgi:protein-tyrosine kinase
MPSDEQQRMVVVTAAERRSGTSTMALGLGGLLAERYGRTLVVDMNGHDPALPKSLELSQEAKGLASVLSDEATIDEAIHPTPVDGLSVMPAGMAESEPRRWLDTPRSEAVFSELRKRFRFVVVDAPPLGQASDAILAGKYSDALVLVAGAATTRSALLEACLEKTGALTGRLVGVVLNMEGYSLAMTRVPHALWTLLTDGTRRLGRRRVF